MSERYCPKCRTDVEDVGGFCLLGHSLKLASVTDSMGDLRAEVDRVFDEVREQVQARIATVTGEIQAVSAPPPPPPPATEAPVVIEVVEEATQTDLDPLWANFDEDLSPDGPDPISAFAPSPRMDWGPEKGRKPKRGDGGQVSPKTA
jgi:hypothetical protein